MTLRKLTPVETQALVAQGAALIDIREPDEHARARIPGARNLPVNRLGRIGEVPAAIYHCRSGGRTDAHAARLAGAADCAAYVLDGGLEAWRAAGLPVTEDRSQPIEIMRQVQIAAGLLIVAGVALGFLVAPAFFALAGLIGAGLTLAGISGWCGMAKLLALMPWNRRAGSPA